MIHISVDHLKWHILISALIAPLGFATFMLVFAWDLYLWLAAIALRVGCLGTAYALLYGRALSFSKAVCE